MSANKSYQNILRNATKVTSNKQIKVAHSTKDLMVKSKFIEGQQNTVLYVNIDAHGLASIHTHHHNTNLFGRHSDNTISQWEWGECQWDLFYVFTWWS